MAKCTPADKVVAFPADRIVRTECWQLPLVAPCGDRPSAAQTAEREEDGLASLIADRVRKKIREWEAAEGRPDELTLLLDRLTVLAARDEGLPSSAQKRLRAMCRGKAVRHG